MEAVLDMGSCSACTDMRKMWKSWRLPLVVMLYCTSFLTVIAQEVPPLFTLEPKSAVVRESAKHIIRCRATPEGSTIHWLFNGKNITDILPDVDIHNEKLVIKSFRTTSRSRQQETQGHDGIYQCVASNSMGGVTSKEATLWSAYISEFYNGFNDMYINVTEGNVAFIPCSPPSGRPDPVIGFELNGTEINQDSDHFQILPSGNLQIRDARPRDRGRYRCTATNSINGEKHKASNTIHLNVIPPMSNSPPVFRWVPPSEVKVVRGENLTLECVVEGAPVPVVTWSKYGGKLPDDRYTMLLGNLVLYNVGKLDEGTYICSADNGIGTRQVAIAQVDVLEPPTIQHPPANQIVSEGTSATFECQGRGQPAVMLEWFHNGRKVESGKGIISIDETSLTINQVRRNHAGVYQCTAKSSLGSVSAAAMLNVLKPGESPPPEVTESAAKWQQEKMQKNAPQTDDSHHDFITTLPQNTSLISGGAAILPCITNQPNVKYGDNFLWLKNSQPIDRMEVVESDNTRKRAGQSPRRGRAHRSHSANQRQRIRRSTNENAESADDILLHMRVTDSNPDYDMKYKSTNEVVRYKILTNGRTGYITKAASANGGPSDKKPDDLVQIVSTNKEARYKRSAGVSQFRVLPSGSLQILNAQVEDSGEYTCVIMIKERSETASAFLTVHLLGDHPSETPSESDGNFKDPSPDRDTSSYPTMPLEGPSNEDGDDIEIREGDGNQRRDKKRRNKNRNRDQPTGDDRELSRKDGGETRDTAETRNNNEEMIPPSKPRVSKLSDTSVMLEWRHPANDGLSVTFFKVQYKEMVRDRSRRHWRTIDEDIPSHVRQFEVPELKPGSTYRFRIVGVYSNNDNKHGANSRKFRLETPSVPGPTVPQTGPVIVDVRTLSQNSITLKWQYSPEEWSPIEGFHIYYHIYGTQSNHLKKTVIGSHVRETQLTGLQPNTIYSIKMQGFNQAGESGDSNTVVKRTSESDEAWEPNWTDLLPGTNTATQTSTLSAEIDEPSLSTESSSKMLYIVLGSVLGAMVLFLLFFMAMCAWKQKQRAQMLAAIEGRNKFQDPSRVIYAQDTVRQKQMNGNGFLLNGLNGVSNHQSNGSVSNGHLPMYTYPRMNVTSNPMQEDGHGSLPHGHTSPTIDYSDYRADNNHSIIQEMLDNPPPPPPMECCEDGRCDSLHDSQRLDFRESPGRYEPNMSTFGRSSKAPPRVRPPLDPRLYDNNSPNYNTTGSQRSHDQNSWQRSHDQNSWRSGNSRIHEPHLTDHIPRSHERLYGRQHQGEPLDGTSEHSRESSSRGSTGKYKHHRRKPSDDRGNSINGTTPQCQGLLSEQSPSSDYKPDHQDGSNSPASTSDELDHPVFSPDHLTGRIPDEVDSDHEHSPLNPNKGHHPVFPPHHLSGHIPPPYDYDYTDTEQEQTDYEQIDESIDSIDHHTPPPAYNRRGYDYHRNISDEEEDGESLPDVPPSPPPLSRLPGIHGYQHTHLQVS